MVACFLWRFPRRGGNYNNTSNTGLGYVNANNTRGNTNTNYGVRSGSASTPSRSKRDAKTIMRGRLRLPAKRHGGKGVYFR